MQIKRLLETTWFVSVVVITVRVGLRIEIATVPSEYRCSISGATYG